LRLGRVRVRCDFVRERLLHGQHLPSALGSHVRDLGRELRRLRIEPGQRWMLVERSLHVRQRGAVRSGSALHGRRVRVRWPLVQRLLSGYDVFAWLRRHRLWHGRRNVQPVCDGRGLHGWCMRGMQRHDVPERLLLRHFVHDDFDGDLRRRGRRLHDLSSHRRWLYDRCMHVRRRARLRRGATLCVRQLRVRCGVVSGRLLQRYDLHGGYCHYVWRGCERVRRLHDG